MADILLEKKAGYPHFLFRETFSFRKMNDMNKLKKIVYIRIFKKLKNVIFRDKYSLDLQNFFKLVHIVHFSE
jgi:hypothetical protein